jgi:hypothetical protein
MSLGAWGSRVARFAGVTLFVGTAACGGGGGSSDHTFNLPAGTAFDTAASDRVLLVVESQNQCGGDNTCVATPDPAATPGPAGGGCDIGNGNTRGLALYRLGTSGLFLEDPTQPGTAAPAEQNVATADNPRKVLVSPSDPTIVYVATNTRIQTFRLAPGGGSRCLGQTLTEHEAGSNTNKDLDPVDFALDATVDNGILYVAGRGSNRVDAYPIAADGTIGVTPTSCIIGTSASQYTSLSILTRDFIVASGRTQIQVFQRVAGEFPRPTPLPGATPTVAPTPGCFGGQLTTDPVSFIGAAIVDDTLFTPSSTSPLGQLFISQEVSNSLITFNIDASGTIGSQNTSHTNKGEGFYQTLLRRDAGGGSFIYSSLLQQGRVVVFQLENGLLPGDALSKTAKDPNTLPVGLAVDGPSGTLLYVAEGGIGRVDAFGIQSNGGLNSVPDSSTAPVVGTTGRAISSFPSDITIIPAP